MAYDPSLFEAERRGLAQQFEAQSAMNEYARFLAQQRGTRQLGEFQEGVRKQVPRFGRVYGRRGLYGQGINSGLFNRAVGEFGAQAATQQQQLQQQLAEQQREFELTGANYLANYQAALADLEARKAREIGATAAGLLNL